MIEKRITHSCGHAVTHFLDGYVSQAERKAGWLAARSCRDCYRNEQRDLQDTASSGAVTGLDLPALEGSDRQIAWATTLRAERIAKARAAELPLDPLLAITAAKTWIDHRNTPLEQLLATA